LGEGCQDVRTYEYYGISEWSKDDNTKLFDDIRGGGDVFHSHGVDGGREGVYWDPRGLKRKKDEEISMSRAVAAHLTACSIN